MERITSRTVLLSVAIGAVTAVLNTYLFVDPAGKIHHLLGLFGYDVGDVIGQLLPGTVFGIGSLIVLRLSADIRPSLVKKIAWIAGNAISFRLAVLGGIASGSIWNLDTEAFAYLVGGLIGSAIVCISYAIAIQRPSLTLVIRLLLIGAAVASLTYGALNLVGVRDFKGGLDSSFLANWLFWPPLFFFWQTAMLLALGKAKKRLA